MGIYLGQYKDYSAMRGPCPVGYHIPNKDEWGALRDAGVSLGARTLSNGTPVKTYLKMPFAGRRSYSAGDVYSRDTDALCWSSSGGVSVGYALNFHASSSVLSARDSQFRSNGLNIRPFKDEPMDPWVYTGMWTMLYSGSGHAGIYWRADLGVITISADGNNWITVADKNLGATTAYNDGDALSEANCGKYYQWGNNYGFPFSGSITTSSTKVDASEYGPGNYYSSSTYIIATTSASDWSSVQNNNLWGGETGIVNRPCPAQGVYIGEALYGAN